MVKRVTEGTFEDHFVVVILVALMMVLVLMFIYLLVSLLA